MGVWVAVVFVTPTAFALLVGLADRKEVLRRVLGGLGYSPMDPSPSAWAYKFHRVQQGAWLVVTLKDGTRVFGKYASRSAAGTEKGHHDLYLEEVWATNDEAPEPPAPHEDGILFAADDIRHVEFTHGDEAGADLGDDHGTQAETTDQRGPAQATGGQHAAQRATDEIDRHAASEELAVSLPAKGDPEPGN